MLSSQPTGGEICSLQGHSFRDSICFICGKLIYFHAIRKRGAINIRRVDHSCPPTQEEGLREGGRARGMEGP